MMSVQLRCSSCDNYRLVPGEDGMLERCLDCLEQCRAHPAEFVVDGRCGACVMEASVAVELLHESRRVAARAMATRAVA